MTLLFENPIPIYFVGAFFLVITGLTFLAQRTLKSLLWLAGVAVATLLLLGLERVIVTQREEVEAALAQLLDALEANDMDGVLAAIAVDATEVRADVQSMMPEANLTDTGATMIHIEAEQDGQASAQFLGRVDGVHRRTGHRLFYLDEVRLDWRKQGDRWVLTDYRAMWDGKPLNAVESMRRNRPKH